jgi:hypothetical protein
MSRATTTRTAASYGGFSSLASSAFQMPDNVFGHRNGGQPRQPLASDTISLEALRYRLKIMAPEFSHTPKPFFAAPDLGRGHAAVPKRPPSLGTEARLLICLWPLASNLIIIIITSWIAVEVSLKAALKSIWSFASALATSGPASTMSTLTAR